MRDGKPGWQSDGSYLTPEGERLTDDFQRTVYLRTVQDWIIRPQMKTVPGVAGADAIGGYVKQFHVQPDPARLIAYGLSFGQIVTAIEANNVSRGANYIERNGEGYVVRTSGRVESRAEIEDIVVATRGAVPVRIKDIAEVTLGRELRTGSASVNGREVVLGTALMLVGGNSRTVAAAADAKIKEINRTLPPSIRAQARAQPDRARRSDDPHCGDEPRGRRASGHSRALPASGQLPRGVDHSRCHPGHHADHRDRNAGGKAQCQPDEPGGARLRADRGRCRHHRREQPAASGGAPASSSAERFRWTSASIP